MQRAKVVLKEAQMDLLKTGQPVIIRLRDTEVELRYECPFTKLFEDLLRGFRQ